MNYIIKIVELPEDPLLMSIPIYLLTPTRKRIPAGKMGVTGIPIGYLEEFFHIDQDGFIFDIDGDFKDFIKDHTS